MSITESGDRGRMLSATLSGSACTDANSMTINSTSTVKPSTKADQRRTLSEAEADILDARWCGRITNDECGKLLAELFDDWYEARATLRMAIEADEPKGT